MNEKIKSAELLADFGAYCMANPDLHFWRALRNWSGHSFIIAADSDLMEGDTFYWKSKDGK